MGRFLGRALRGAGKALEKGVESADAVIDGPVTGGIKQVTDTSKQAINKMSSGIADRTAPAGHRQPAGSLLSDGKDDKHMAVGSLPGGGDDGTPTASATSAADQFIGESVNRKKLDEMLNRGVLMSSETLEAAIWGSVESSRLPTGGARSKHMDMDLVSMATGLDKRSGLLGLTNRRVIFYMPKMMNRYEFEAYKIKQIDSVQFTKGMRKGRVDISTMNSNRVVKDVNNGEGKIIVERIQQAMERLDEQSSTPTVVVDAQDPIKALKMKFVNGEITQEEYETKKAILED